MTNYFIFLVSSKVHLALYSILPFIAMAIANMLLIYTFYSKSKQMLPLTIKRSVSIINLKETSDQMDDESRQEKNDKMNRKLLITTCIFIILTSPSACASFFFDTLSLTDSGSFIIVLLDSVSFTYNGLHFILFSISNKVFRKQFFKLLRYEKF